MYDFLKYLLGNAWQLLLITGVFLFVKRNLGSLYKTTAARKRWIGYLIQNTWMRRYHRSLESRLNWLDTHLSPNFSPKVRGSTFSDMRRAWSYGLLNWSILLAFSYPVLGLLLYRATSIEAPSLGATVLINFEPSDIKRTLPIIIIAIAAFLANRALRIEQWIRWPIYAVAAILLYLLMLILPANLFQGELVASVVGIYAATFAGVFSIAVGGTFAGSFVIAAVGALAIAATGTLVNEFWYIGAGAFLIVSVVFLALKWIGQKFQLGAVCLLGFSLCQFSALIFLAHNVDVDAAHQNSASSILVMLGFLPVVNALADFLSVGLTRFLVRQGLKGHVFWATMADIFGAVLVFALLIFSLIAICVLVRYPGGQSILELSFVFADLRTNPSNYWWFYVTILSTLVPTLLHLSLSLLSVMLGGTPSLRKFIVNGLEAGARGHEDQGKLAVLLLSIIIAAAILAPILLLTHVFLNIDSVGIFIIYIAEEFNIMVQDIYL